MATFKEVMIGIADSIRKVKNTNEKIKIANIPSQIDKLAYIDNGSVTGVVNRAEVNTSIISLNVDTGNIESTVTVKKGYIDEGVLTGSTMQLDIASEQTLIPSTIDQIIPKGKYLIGDQTIVGDNNLKPENILRGLDPVKSTSDNPVMLSVFGVEGTVDKIHAIKGYNKGSGFYGMQVADVAKSYHFARVSGLASFQYNQDKTPFGGAITDENGNCLLDCSGFISFVLRGIPYEKSPFNGATGTANKTWDPTQIATLCQESEYVWADYWLDHQTDSDFRDIGLSSQGYYSIRNAAQIAEYYYTKGCVVHEYTTDPTAPPDDLLPGDLLFWSKDGARVTQKSRFKAISHVGVVAHDGIHYYQVTGSSDTKGETVFYSNLANKDTNGAYDKLVDLCLILRPNYTPQKPIYSPIGVNLMPKYKIAGPITSDGNTTEISGNNTKGETGWTRYGVTIVQKIDGSLTLSGKTTADMTCYIYGQIHPIKLSAGTYKLSGAPSFTGATTKQWGMGIKTISGPDGTPSADTIAWDNGSGDRFTLSTDSWCYVYIYVGNSLTSTISNKVFKPSLIRTA